MTSEKNRADEMKRETTKAVSRGHASDAVAVSLAWLAVGIPLLWGVIQTLRRSLALFG